MNRSLGTGQGPVAPAKCARIDGTAQMENLPRSQDKLDKSDRNDACAHHVFVSEPEIRQRRQCKVTEKVVDVTAEEDFSKLRVLAPVG